MSHFTVLVIGEDPETLLAPYDENLDVAEYRDYEEGKPQDHWTAEGMIERGQLAKDFDGWEPLIAAYNERYGDDPMFYDAEQGRAYTLSTSNPKAKWDWYSLGGRWTGFFKLRDHATGTLGRPGLGSDTPKPGWVDQARKHSIDWDGMRAQREAEAISEHSQAMAALAGQPPVLGWDHVREELFPGDIDSARRFFHNQPGMKELRNLDRWYEDPARDLFLNEPDPQAAYVQRAVGKVGLPFAILTADGWAEKGHMGWFACVTDEKADWNQTAADIIATAPGDALFSLYDCHI